MRNQTFVSSRIDRIYALSADLLLSNFLDHVPIGREHVRETGENSTQCQKQA